MTTPLFDHRLLEARRSRAARCGPPPVWAFRLAAECIAGRLENLGRSFENALAIGVESRYLAPLTPMVSSWQDMPRWQQQKLEADHHMTEEAFVPLLPPGRHDLVVSALALHVASDLPGALLQLRAGLRPGGTLLVLLPGPGTMASLRHLVLAGESRLCAGAATRFLPLVSAEAGAGLLERLCLGTVVADSEFRQFVYKSLADFCRDVRSLAATNILAGATAPMPRALAREIGKAFAAGTMPVELEIVTLTGRVPREHPQPP